MHQFRVSKYHGFLVVRQRKVFLDVDRKVSLKAIQNYLSKKLFFNVVLGQNENLKKNMRSHFQIRFVQRFFNVFCDYLQDGTKKSD